MASPTLVLPGVIFVGEDERSRTVAMTGPAAGWMRPKGLLQWSNEISVVPRAAFTEEVKRETKAVMPEEQIPPARMPLTLQAAQKSPLVAVGSKLVPKLVEKGVRVHTVGVDQVTSSFYYLAEGGGEDPVRAEGDLVAAVGAMLGERADNAAIERTMDGLLDRLLRALSQDRLDELAIELAASLPRATNDGTGLRDVDLEAFERQLAQLVGSSEKYKAQTQQIADAIARTNEQRVDLPLFGDARKVSQASLEIALGDRSLALPTYERWVLTGPFKEPAPAPKPVETKPPSETKPVEAKPIEGKPIVDVASPKPAAASPKPAEAVPRAVPRPTSSPAKEEAKPDFAPAKTAEPEARKDEKAAKEEKKPEPKVEAEAEKKAAGVEADEKKADDEKKKIAEAEERNSATQKVRKREGDKREREIEKKGGVPWLAIILIVVFAIIAWQVWLKQ